MTNRITTNRITEHVTNQRGSTRRAAALLASALILMPVITATRAQGQAPPASSRLAVAGHPGPNFQKPTDAALRKLLTPEQYKMTQRDGTEPAFHNAYNNNHEAGIYVDLVSGEPLFSSLDKFESGTGWPSFTRPLEPANVKTRIDHQGSTDRTEVRSAHADSHLGHVFNDGPKPTGLRYCMNSASLRFVPANRLHEEGYGEYANLFDGTDR